MGKQDFFNDLRQVSVNYGVFRTVRDIYKDIDDTLFAEYDKTQTQEAVKPLPAPTPEGAIAGAYWARCLEIIRDNVDKSAFVTWFKPISAIEYKNSELTIRMPSQFFCEWIEEHYYSLLQKTISEVLGEGTKLKYFVDVAHTDTSTQSIKLPAFKYPPTPPATSGIQSKSHAAADSYNTNLHPAYTFDSFVAGESNQLAYSAAKAVAEKPGKTRFNPLFIYGKTGLGKTHLVSAIGNEIVRTNNKLRVMYTSSENFSIEFVNSIKNNKPHEFKNFYQSFDVLIIDDIQFLAGRDKTQDNFFHIFNSIHSAGGQIVIVSDKSPKEIQDIDARLISRFQWGLVVDIPAPDLEMRMALLFKKSEAEGIELPNDVCEYVAKNVTTSVRELEGVLISLMAKHTFDDREINLELAREVVKNNIAVPENNTPTVDTIKDAVAAYYNLSPQLLESKSRKHEIALARQMAIYLTKEFLPLPLKAIGKEFGGRDHSTILHSCQAIENYLALDKSVNEAYNAIKEKFAK